MGQHSGDGNIFLENFSRGWRAARALLAMGRLRTALNLAIWKMNR